MKIGEGKGNLSPERFPFPSPNPTPSSSKTFDFIESLLAVFPAGTVDARADFRSGVLL